ncbi:hypothetical protein [Roseisalinus antarcticus]|uniref:Curlin minor subunit CsgB n=1 Tax=Roseisalinus antarcticus TaxID=254357 RepID=A0A1Y5TRB6_9RHOB|nr:hypothetical protein [Roseisalinus antarcticus]SLN70214.1 curlin minor subunit CsgB [Roseisalinus antarcticus]
MFRTTLLSIALCLSALTAAADGQAWLTINPRNAEEAALVRFGLAAYALHKDIEENGHVTQRGADNAAGIYQGACDFALIEQQGSGHRGTINQRNCDNAGAIFQSGRNTDANLDQSGGQTGVIFIHGF